MKRLIGFLLLANAWTYAQDGLFFQDSATPARAAIEGNQLVLRVPLLKTTIPKAKGILLVDSEWNSKPAYTIHIILDKVPAGELSLVVVLGDAVFWKTEVRRLRDGTGWLSLPVEASRNPSECLRNAGKVFGAEQQWQLDLRLSDEERAKAAKVQGQFSAADVREISHLVFTMASRQILEHLAQYTHDAWQRVLRTWPGRHALDIGGGGQGAAVYYAPDAGYQLEKINAKWTIVGG